MSKQRNYIYLRRSANICMQLIFQAPTMSRTTTTENQTNRNVASASQKRFPRPLAQPDPAQLSQFILKSIANEGIEEELLLLLLLVWWLYLMLLLLLLMLMMALITMRQLWQVASVQVSDPRLTTHAFPLRQSNVNAWQHFL